MTVKASFLMFILIVVLAGGKQTRACPLLLPLPVTHHLTQLFSSGIPAHSNNCQCNAPFKNAIHVYMLKKTIEIF